MAIRLYRENSNLPTSSWFKLLKKPYDKQAEDNFIAQHGQKVFDTHRCNSMSSALNAFNWSSTPEGQKYWNQVNDNAESFIKPNLVEYAEEV